MLRWGPKGAGRRQEGPKWGPTRIQAKYDTQHVEKYNVKHMEYK